MTTVKTTAPSIVYINFYQNPQERKTASGELGIDKRIIITKWILEKRRAESADLNTLRAQ
jgi:hypothetical protein